MVSLVLQAPQAALKISNLNAAIPTFTQILPYDNAAMPVK
jgi:hypothetical protein